MAKAKTKVPRKAVVPAPATGKQVAVGSWRERAAKSVQTGKAASALLPSQSGNFLSFRNGVLTLGGVKLPNPLDMVILAYGPERVYYARPYQADSQATPDCYSFDGNAPHERAATPQHDHCASCHQNEFGTAENGKGKACKEGARFIAIDAASLESLERIATATLVQGRLSVLNSKGFKSYVSVFEELGSPIWSTVSRLTVQPDSKSQYATLFQSVTTDMADDLLDALAARIDEAEKLMSQPYPEPVEAPPPKAKAPARRRF